MAWFEAEYYDPMYRKMLANFIAILQTTVEVILPSALGYALVIFLTSFLLYSIATACGWDPESRKKAQREELAGELAERAEGRAATATGCSEKRDELETVKAEMESLQEMLRERTGKLVTLATREKGE